MWRILVSFISGFLIDVLYVGWFSSVSRTMYIRGAIFSMTIAACTLVGFADAMEDRALAVPYLLGLGVGTIVGIRIQKKR